MEREVNGIVVVDSNNYNDNIDNGQKHIENNDFFPAIKMPLNLMSKYI